VLLGYSQVTVLPVAQAASVVGVFGVSALVAAVSSALAYAARGAPRRVVVVGVTLGLLVAIGGWGQLRIADGRLTREGRPMRVGLVQGNVAQEAKWDPARAVGIFRDYLRLTREAAAQGARFIIWPESSTPFFFEEDPRAADLIRALARELRVEILVGSDQIERGSPRKYYNAAFLVGAAGETRAVYRKIHLVPFGEYVPLKRLLFFAGPLVESVSDFSPGADLVMLPVAEGRASTAICYEIVYPALVRAAVNAGSELLTTITNDAWYGESSAPHQHFAQASMRAIEEGRYLARSANTGISGFVDPYGRVLDRSPLFEQRVLTGEVRFLTGRTIYARIGDTFANGCLALTLAALLATRFRPRGKRSSP
jgi:apolipoprotein N-acyltransferase